MSTERRPCCVRGNASSTEIQASPSKREGCAGAPATISVRHLPGHVRPRRRDCSRCRAGSTTCWYDPRSRRSKRDATLDLGPIGVEPFVAWGDTVCTAGPCRRWAERYASAMIRCARRC